MCLLHQLRCHDSTVWQHVAQHPTHGPANLTQRRSLGPNHDDPLRILDFSGGRGFVRRAGLDFEGLLSLNSRCDARLGFTRACCTTEQASHDSDNRCRGQHRSLPRHSRHRSCPPTPTGCPGALAVQPAPIHARSRTGFATPGLSHRHAIPRTARSRSGIARGCARTAASSCRSMSRHP